MSMLVRVKSCCGFSVSGIEALESISFFLLCPALEPSQIVSFFEPVFEKAKELEKAYERFTDQTKVPFITVSPLSLSLPLLLSLSTLSSPFC